MCMWQRNERYISRHANTIRQLKRERRVTCSHIKHGKNIVKAMLAGMKDIFQSGKSLEAIAPMSAAVIARGE
eukprot:12882572-Prorocentrum_lima.AAC.1